jgi:class 3 adenylate cyclase
MAGVEVHAQVLENVLAQSALSRPTYVSGVELMAATLIALAIVEELAKNPDRLVLGGETREMTIMFSDVRGFTAISDRSPTRTTRKVSRV